MHIVLPNVDRRIENRLIFILLGYQRRFFVLREFAGSLGGGRGADASLQRLLAPDPGIPLHTSYGVCTFLRLRSYPLS
jgi:hypothetical protein